MFMFIIQLFLIMFMFMIMIELYNVCIADLSNPVVMGQSMRLAIQPPQPFL